MLAPAVIVALRERLTASERTGIGRLPPERVLAAEFSVSRAEIRKALAVMETEGRLVRHVGRGTFLRQESRALPDVEEIAQRIGPREAMQARLILEPEVAALAAVNASARQINELKALSAETRASQSWPQYEHRDTLFHKAIADASGNALLGVVHAIVNDVRRAVIWAWLDTRAASPPTDYTSFDEHDTICAAIERRDRNAAADAMRQHLQTTYARIIGGTG